MAQVKAKGASSVNLIGKNYEGTIRVCPKGKEFVKENAEKIWYDGWQGTWKMKTKQDRNSTLARQIFLHTHNKKTQRGRIAYENGDNTDMRSENLVARYS